MKTGFAIVGFVFVALIVGTCVACVDDNEEEGSWLPRMELTASGNEDGRNRNGDSDCKGAEAPCEDNDLSPSFDKSPVTDSFNPEVTVCLPGSRCGGDGDGDRPAEEADR